MRLSSAALLHTTSVLALLVGGVSSAWSDNLTSGTTTVTTANSTTTYTISGSGSLVINAGSGLLQTGSSVPVTWNNTTSGSGITIDNAGTISNTGTGRALDTSGGTSPRTLTLTNRAGAVISSVANDAVRINTNISSGSVTIVNAGTIRAAAPTDPASATQGQALDLRAMNSAGVTLSITNTATGLIEALNDDALRPGLNATIDNSGIIRSYGANTSGGANGTADGIDAGGRTGVVVTNRDGGLISGARHGITADSDISVVNQAGGTIIGRNGSGVGSDGTGTVTNYGTITGAYAGAGNIFNSSGTASLNGDGDGVDIDLIGTVTNYGLIEGTGAGGVDSGGQTNTSEGIAMGGGTITNYAGATIRGAGKGILIDNGSGGSAAGATTIVNHGSIIGQAGAAITLVGPFNDSITTSGTISGVGTAIDMGDGDDTLTITGGTISGNVYGGAGNDSLTFALGTGGAFTLSGTYSGFESVALASGTLTVAGSLNGPLTVASGATLRGSNTSLTLAGTVTLASGSTVALGITPSQAYNLAVTGNVSLGGGTLVISPTAGSYADGATYDIITASGGISGTFSSIQAENSARLGGLVISGTNLGTSYRLTLATGASFTGGADSVTFIGRAVTTDLNGQGGDDSITFQGTGNSLSANVSGISSLTIGASDRTSSSLILQSGSQKVASTEILANATLTANTTLTSQTVTVDSGGTLKGVGTIVGALTNAGTVAPGSSPGVLTVQGSYTSAGNATLVIEVDGATPGTGAGHHDQIVVTGTPGTFTAAGTLVATTRGISGSASNSYTPSLGQTFTIVSASGGILGSFSGLTQPASGLASGTRFDLSYGRTSLTLAVTPGRYAALSGLSGNQQALAGAIDAVRPAAGTRTGTDLDSLYNALYTTAAADLTSALGQLSGAVHAETLAAALGAQRLFSAAVAERAVALRQGTQGATLAAGRAAGFGLGGGSDGLAGSPAAGLAGGEGAASGLGQAWVRGLGRVAGVDGDATAAGADSRSGGVAFGLDRPLGANLTLGLAGGYLHSWVDSKGDGASGAIDTYALAAYASYSESGLFADAALNYGYSRYDSRRPLAFGTVNAVDRLASASSHGHQLGAALQVGYTWRWQGAALEPAAGLRYDQVRRAGFSESGAGALDLTVADQTLHALTGSVGVRASRAYPVAGATVEPQLRLRWEHDLLDTTGTSNATLAGSSFTVSGARPGRDAAVAGAGVTAQLDQQLALFADYDASVRARATAHAFTAGLRYRW